MTHNFRRLTESGLSGSKELPPGRSAVPGPGSEKGWTLPDWLAVSLENGGRA